MPVELLAFATVVFLIAGIVKGTVGLGLPMVAVAGLALAMNLIDAFALILAPSLAANAWQALAGPHLAALVRRFWSFLVAMAAGVWVATGFLSQFDPLMLTGLLGVIVTVHGVNSLAGFRLPHPGRHERWMTPVTGGVNGLVTGVTATYVVPSTIYLQALRLETGAFIQAMGVLFFAATCMLGAGLAGHGLLSADMSWLSAAAVAPAMAGVWLGARLRRRLSPERFRQAFLAGLLATGAYLCVKGFGATLFPAGS